MRRILAVTGVLVLACAGVVLCVLHGRSSAEDAGFDPSRGLPAGLTKFALASLLEDSGSDSPVHVRAMVARLSGYRETVSAWHPKDGKGKELRDRELQVIAEIAQVENTRQTLLGNRESRCGERNLGAASRKECWSDYADGERRNLVAMLRGTARLATALASR